MILCFSSVVGYTSIESILTQQTFTFSKSATETLEKNVKYVHR